MKNISKFLGLALIATSATSFAAMDVGTANTVGTVVPTGFAHHGVVISTANSVVNLPFSLPTVTAQGFIGTVVTQNDKLADFTVTAPKGQRVCLDSTNVTTDIPGKKVEVKSGTSPASVLSAGVRCSSIGETFEAVFTTTTPGAVSSGTYGTTVRLDIYAD
ncbi:hypothetical protein DK757_27210 [Salmonella enterica subsp. enterica serovar Blockley]|nr:hypothetical protein [Salmonella enterica subsp. enterica serovar Blockley]